MAAHTILWRGLSRPGYESARLSFENSLWRLTGASVFLHNQQPCRLNYEVVCDSEWNTVSARVAGWLETRTIEVELNVDADHYWRQNGKEIPGVRGAIDLDLNFSPATNLLPIRRLNLAIGEEAEVKAAWLRFAGFTLEPLHQVYRRISAGTYQYESANGEFKADLTVNEVGFVTEYPDFFTLEAITES